MARSVSQSQRAIWFILPARGAGHIIKFVIGQFVRSDSSISQSHSKLPARATFVADTNFLSGTQKMSLILYRNNLCPQQMSPSLRS